MDYFKLDMPRDELLSMSSLGLAHLGDGVFEVMVRSWLCLRGKARPRDLHRATVKYVAAPAQAAAVERLLPILTEEEAGVYRRGRTPPPTLCPRRPAAPSTSPPPAWRPCSAGSISRGGPTGSTSSFSSLWSPRKRRPPTLAPPVSFNSPTSTMRCLYAVRRTLPVRAGP